MQGHWASFGFVAGLRSMTAGAAMLDRLDGTDAHPLDPARTRAAPLRNGGRPGRDGRRQDAVRAP